MDLKDKKILMTGGAGFVGGALIRKLISRGAPEENILIPRSEDTDLRRQENCEKAVRSKDVVFHLAAVVGGIVFNRDHPGALFYDNAAMALHLLEAARLAGVQKFVGVGSVCEYPKFTPVPFEEKRLWDGYPEETNAPYGLAKKFMLVQSQAYREEYRFNAIHLLMINLYGPGDNFSEGKSHVIPALIKKVAEAKKENKDFINVWGTGRATRDFLYVDDAAEAIIRAAEAYDASEPINIGSGMEISIKDLVELICRLMDFRGEVRWDATKPDGQPRRSLDVSKAEREFGFRAQTSFEDGLRKTIAWYETSRV